jgi:hypothetical protein
MPTTENKDPTPDDRDAKIVDLQKQVETLTADLADANAKLKKKAAAAVADNCAVLDGKTYQIEKTVMARFATDEARKGHIDLDSELSGSTYRSTDSSRNTSASRS